MQQLMACSLQKRVYWTVWRFAQAVEYARNGFQTPLIVFLWNAFYWVISLNLNIIPIPQVIGVAQETE